MENSTTIPLTDDQHFLLHLVIGVYFAPDLNDETTPRSPLQRLAEHLPNYNPNDLTGSHMEITMLECVYFFLLRNCKPSVVIEQSRFLQYINGSHPVSVEGSFKYPSFNSLFPPDLHKRSQDTIGNIIFVKNPNTDYMEACVVERFKRLTGLKDFLFEKDSSMLHVLEEFYNVKVGEACNSSVVPSRLSTYRNNNNYDIDHPSGVIETCSGVESLDEGMILASTYSNDNNNNDNNDGVCHSLGVTETSNDNNNNDVRHSLGVTETGSGVDCLDKGMIFVRSCLSMEEWGNMIVAVKSGIAVRGSAVGGGVGPVLGLMDVGESEDSYLFRVSLPGVRRDERDFSCEFESDGTVIIKGVKVMGERMVKRYSHAFEMQSQNMGPPGPFSITFKLPGRVDPKRFHGTFETNGILEVIVYKERACTTS